jgi:Protein of unknown function (DUF3025)
MAIPQYLFNELSVGTAGIMHASLRQPWLRPWQPLLTKLGRPDQHWLARANVLAQRHGICVNSNTGLRFVDAAALSAPVYDSHIADHGQVPTRLAPAAAAWHDYFNALVWLGMPRAKAALHGLQAQTIALHGTGGRRGARRDALTVFDENSLLLLCSVPSLADALRRMDWHELLVVQRGRFIAHCSCVLFGHALMQKLLQPYKAICAHVWIMPVTQAIIDTAQRGDPQLFAALDAAIAAAITAGQLTMTALTPLPVLGVPGWWPANEVATFYNDARVFRTTRQRRQSQ